VKTIAAEQPLYSAATIQAETSPTTDPSTPRHAPRRGRRQARQLIAGAAAVLSMTTVGLLTTASPAAAAAPPCTTRHTFSINSGTLYAPAGLNSYGTYTWDCWLAYGDSNSAVRQLQSNINNCYGTTYYGGKNLGIKLSVDGVYGSKTKAAVVLVQQQYWYLARDGVYGPNTAEAMWHMGYVTALGRLRCVHTPQPMLS